LCYGLITNNKILKNPTILGHAIGSRATIVVLKKFEKIEVCDELSNCLLCVIKVHNYSNVIIYWKGCFSWLILNKGVWKGWK
jgi:hypothetical protein